MQWRLVILGLSLLAAPTQTLVINTAVRRPASALSPAMRRSSSSGGARFAFVQMQEGDSGDGGERQRSKGKTITVARPKPKPKQDRKEDVDIDKSWRVLLHNDDVRLANTPTAPPDRCCGISHSRALTSHTPFASLAVQVHTFDYVTMAIVKVVKTITRKKAHRITVQCHSMGTATVTTTWKQMAKQMCLKLQKFGLTSSIAPDGS